MTNEQIKGSFKENKSMLKRLIAEYVSYNVDIMFCVKYTIRK